jgi:hypothetical protein
MNRISNTASNGAKVINVSNCSIYILLGAIMAFVNPSLLCPSD